MRKKDIKGLTINFIAGPYLPIPPLKGGGVEVYIYNLALELSRKYRVRIYSRRYKGLENHENIGNLEIIRISGFEKGDNSLLNLLKELAFGLTLFFNLKSADINHFFHLKSYLFYLACPHKAKDIVHLQTTFDGLTAGFLRFADSVIPVSNHVRDYFKENGYIRGDKTFVVPNGVDTERFKEPAGSDNLIRKRYDLKELKAIGYVGRISREKGIEYLIDAFKMLRDRRDDIKLFLIGPYHESEYGDPVFRSYLDKIIKGYHLEKDVYFTGLVQHEELPAYYAACDLVCLPSVWEEPFGITCIEALACGKVVIATDSGAFKEIIADRADGFIVPKKDPAAILERITLLLDDAALKERIQKAAAEKARFYSFKSIAKKYEEVYNRLI